MAVPFIPNRSLVSFHPFGYKDTLNGKCQCGLVMEDESWWPQGIAISSYRRSTKSRPVAYQMGSRVLLGCPQLSLSSWWKQAKKDAWGVLAELSPTSIEILREDGNRTLMQLDETHLALAYSIPTSNRTSSLHRTQIFNQPLCQRILFFRLEASA